MSARKHAEPRARKHGPTYGLPFRQRRAPAPCAVVDDPAQVAAVVAERIRRIARKRGCGCYLFLDQRRQVYVVSEDSGAAHHWAVEHTDWWLGCWSGSVVTEDVLAELVDACR